MTVSLLVTYLVVISVLVVVTRPAVESVMPIVRMRFAESTGRFTVTALTTEHYIGLLSGPFIITVRVRFLFAVAFVYK